MLLISFVLNACGNQEDESDEIASETEVLDLAISSNQELVNHYSEQVKVGFNENTETRLLLNFPEFSSLYREDVIISSIANLELELYASKVPVNPENIVLRFISKPWSPFATWTSKFSLAPGYEWNIAGGDFHALSASNPGVEANGSSYRLVFDVTDQLITAVSNELPVEGFAISVTRSTSNAEQAITLFTSNSRLKPKVVLTFNTSTVIAP